MRKNDILLPAPGAGTGELQGTGSWADRRPADGEPTSTLVEVVGDQESPAVGGNRTGGCPLATLRRRLGDGTSVYLYGLGRVGEEGAAG